MHEFSVVQSLIDVVEREARARNAVAVSRVQVRVGQLSGVEPELLRTAFELVRETTLAKGASLDIDYVQTRWGCAECGQPLEPRTRLRCTACGGPPKLLAGEELDLDSLELRLQ